MTRHRHEEIDDNSLPSRKQYTPRKQFDNDALNNIAEANRKQDRANHPWRDRAGSLKSKHKRKHNDSTEDTNERTE